MDVGEANRVLRGAGALQGRLFILSGVRPFSAVVVALDPEFVVDVENGTILYMFNPRFGRQHGLKVVGEPERVAEDRIAAALDESYWASVHDRDSAPTEYRPNLPVPWRATLIPLSIAAAEEHGLDTDGMKAGDAVHERMFAEGFLVPVGGLP